MDTVLIVQMACEERNNSVSVTSTYGEAKCFGPKNCHAAFDPRTGNVLSCDPNGEPICGKNCLRVRICVSHDRGSCEIGVNERSAMRWCPFQRAVGLLVIPFRTVTVVRLPLTALESVRH